MNLAVLFGSSSNEHEVSVVSASAVIKNLNKSKYKITPIYLDKDNKFYKWKGDINNIEVFKIGELPLDLEEIKEPFSLLKSFDLVFVMVHGANGEDGVISSILDFLKVKYVANTVETSVVTMDKILTKDILEANGIRTAKYMYLTKYNDEYIIKDKSLTYSEIVDYILERFCFPLFVKPARSGSSIGVFKVKNKNELINSLREALKIDERILIEEMVVGREIECAVLECAGSVITSELGEVLTDNQFYSFDAKYNNVGSRTIIPAMVSDSLKNKIKEKTKAIFKILNVHGYSRVDFFVDGKDNVILNEINTIPGFTEISMYPKLFLESGISFSTLLDILIDNAIFRN